MVKLPHENKNDKLPAKPVDINKLIDRGAPVKKGSEPKKWTFVHIRLSTTFLEEIDAVWPQIEGLTRTGWVLQTLRKELNRLKSKKDD